MLSLDEIIKSSGGTAHNLKNTEINGISTDSRTIGKGNLFIAIKGENFDGHDFIKEVFDKGAAAVVADSEYLRKGNIKNEFNNLIIVKDTIRALGDAAHYFRMKFDIPIVGITGSTGKTTAKEIISFILSDNYRVLKNEGTKNNHIGVPQTLFNLNGDSQVAVLEMGTNHFGEIKRLAEIAKPTIGVITNIGPSHLEFFKTVRMVFKAKSELLNSLDRKSLALLNRDDRFLERAKTKCKKIYYGIEKNCEFHAKDIELNENNIAFRVGKTYFKVAVVGKHNVYNVLAGIGIGEILGMSFQAISKRLIDFKNPLTNRLSLCQNKNIYILDDTYNSNPLSFEKAVDTLKNLKCGKRKVIISSDMLELGDKSKSLHVKIGKLIAKSGIDLLVTVGPMSKYTSEGAKENGMKKNMAMHFEEKDHAIEKLNELLKKDDVILIKGSRAMHMEKIVDAIKERNF